MSDAAWRSADRPAACGPASTVQRRMDTWTHDLSEAQPGKPQQARVQRIVGQGRGQVGGECLAAPRGQAGEIDQDGAGQVAQRISAASAGRIARLNASCAAALTPPDAVAAPASTSIAVNAGVGWIDRRAPPGRSVEGSASPSIRPASSASNAARTG